MRLPKPAPMTPVEQAFHFGLFTGIGIIIVCTVVKNLSEGGTWYGKLNSQGRPVGRRPVL